MFDATESLWPLQREIREINAKNGWDTPAHFSETTVTSIATKLMLIVTECSEAMEALRNRRPTVEFAMELADVLIRTLDLAEGLGLNMAQEVRAKLEVNRERGFRHGGKAL